MEEIAQSHPSLQIVTAVQKQLHRGEGWASVQIKTSHASLLKFS